jgi:hypothetical protein
MLENVQKADDRAPKNTQNHVTQTPPNPHTPCECQTHAHMHPLPTVKLQHSMRDGTLALADAPVFRPSAAQFADPIAYIKSIRADAEPFGICKVLLVSLACVVVVVFVGCVFGVLFFA